MKNDYILTRWSIPFAGFLLALAGGVSYAWGVFVIPMTERFGWSTAEATLPFTFFMIIFALTMVPAGILQDRIGPKKVSAVGAIMLLLAYGLASLVDVIRYPWWLILTYSLIGGIACGLVYACVAPPARKWFPDKPGLSISLAVMGFGLASVFVAPLKANYFIPNFGISGTFLILAVSTSLVSLFAAWLIRDPKEGWKPEGWQEQKVVSKEVKRHKYKASQIVRDPLFILIWAMFALVAAGGLVAIGLIPSFGENEIGLTPVDAAIALSFFAALNGFGRPLAGYLSDRFGVLRIMSLTYVIQALAFLSIPFLVSSATALYVVATVLGWGYAVTLALFPTLTSKSFGVENLGTNYGLVFTAFGVGAISPAIGASVFDSTGSYTSIFMIAGLLTAIGLGVSVIIKMRYSLD